MTYDPRQTAVEVAGKWMMDDHEKDYPSLYTRIEKALSEAFAAGRKAGLEEAKKIAGAAYTLDTENGWGGACETILENIKERLGE